VKQLETWVALSVNPRLAHSALAWASACTFQEAVELAGGLFEGTVLRGLRRTAALLGQAQFAARAAGMNCALMEQAWSAMMRGMVGSLDDACFEVADVADAIAQPHPIGTLIRMHPAVIGFSQRKCSSQFKATGVQLTDTLAGLLDGRISESEFDPLPVYWHGGAWFTLGNRRLALWRLFAMHKPGQHHEILVRVASDREAEQWNWKDNFTTGMTRGRRIKVRTLNAYIGLSASDTDPFFLKADLRRK